MKLQLEQERIVLVLAIALFVVFCVTVPKFATPQNILILIRDVSVLGILALGMAVVVIGRGVDLSMVATMAISVAWIFQLTNQGVSVPLAVAAGFAFALGTSLITGFLIAYVEVPALFGTLAMGTFIYGIGKSQLVPTDAIYMPANFGALASIGSGKVLGIPAAVLLLAAFCGAVSLLLTRTRLGRFFYAIGDNQQASRIAGIPVRPTLMLQYLISGFVAVAAGLILATSVAAMNTRIVNSTLIYDIILVVVLGGVGLSGGRGRVRNVIVGTLFIGTLVNGMTILDIPYTVQNIIKSLILLGAIVTDGFINPRDEQTAQQGDI